MEKLLIEMWSNNIIKSQLEKTPHKDKEAATAVNQSLQGNKRKWCATQWNGEMHFTPTLVKGLF